MTQKSSYGQILKASSIMGGAAGISLLLGMVRTKFVAVLIGTSGVGLIASFGAIQGIIGTMAGLGIQSSGVRDVAAAVAKGDELAIGRAVLTLRRVCRLTGLVGMLAMMAFSPMLGQLTFGSEKYTLDIAALGIIILFGNLSGGQMALIQGMRRIGDMARANIIGAAAGTVIAIGFYTWLGLRGIVPTLVAVAGIQLALSWIYARRVPVPAVSMTWRETFIEANGMVRLGIVFMWTGLMGSVVSYITIALITQQVNLQAVGIFSAAFALSGVFVNFVLGAMGADYYPRLTGVAHDKVALTRLVNEQTEIGLLIAFPGLVATMALAPIIIKLLYTDQFLPATALLQWFTLGCLGRVISWPLGYVILALSKSKIQFIVETVAELIHVLLIFHFLKIFGLVGVAIAFPVLIIITTIAYLKINKNLINFYWESNTKKLVIVYIFLLSMLLTVIELLGSDVGLIIGLMFAIVAAFNNFKKIRAKVGKK